MLHFIVRLTANFCYSENFGEIVRYFIYKVLVYRVIGIIRQHLYIFILRNKKETEEFLWGMAFG